MAEQIMHEILSPSGRVRVVIIRREDGRFTYRRLERVGEEWGPATIDAGVYDSPGTAEAEARQREPWLRELFH